MSSEQSTVIEIAGEVAVGDRIRFTPGPYGNRWWTVHARDERFIVATMQAPFQPKGSPLLHGR